jgi:hypothetical protein
VALRDGPYPDPQAGQAAQIKREDLEYYERMRGELWPDGAELRPTRPLDADLLPRAHLHADGHYCDSRACDLLGRGYRCEACLRMEREMTKRPSRGMDPK